LKLRVVAPVHVGAESPPAWGRGLKLWLLYTNSKQVTVAPRVGAWIETSRR